MLRPVCLSFQGLLLVLLAASSASADTIQFTDFTHSGASAVDWLVTVDDDTSGVFTVNVGIDGSSPNQFADITGIAFSITGALSGGLATTDILDATAAPTDFVRSYIGPDDLFGSGSGQVNFSGGTPTVGLFDAALGYASGPTMLTSIQFTVSTLGGTLGLDDWTKFGVRGQSVGATAFGEGSSKDWSVRSHAPSPTALVNLLGLGLTLVGFRWWRRRRS